MDKVCGALTEPASARIDTGFDDREWSPVVSPDVKRALGVLPMDVGHAGDGWLAVQGGVWPVMVVDVQPARQGFASG